MFYRWQKEFFENAAAFEPRARRAGGDDKDRRIALLEQKLWRSMRSSRNSWRNISNLKMCLGSSERSLGGG
jgi:hypothetical protein